MISAQFFGRLAVLCTLPMLWACSPGDMSSDPKPVDLKRPDLMRAAFMDACPKQRPYAHRDPVHVTKYCGCKYDSYVKGLDKNETLVMQFYLLSQAEVDVREIADFKKMNMNSIHTVLEKFEKGDTCAKP